MNAKSPIDVSPVIINELEAWKFKWWMKHKGGMGDIIILGGIYFLAILCLFMGIYKIINGIIWSFDPYIYLISAFALIMGGGIFLPMHPVRIEKKGPDLKYRIKGALYGILPISRDIPLNKVKSWYYSDKTMTLGLELPNDYLRGKNGVKKEGTFFAPLSLDGINDKDLAFLLDWFGHHYIRKEPVDED